MRGYRVRVENKYFTMFNETFMYNVDDADNSVFFVVTEKCENYYCGIAFVNSENENDANKFDKLKELIFKLANINEADIYNIKVHEMKKEKIYAFLYRELARVNGKTNIRLNNLNDCLKKIHTLKNMYADIYNKYFRPYEDQYEDPADYGYTKFIEIYNNMLTKDVIVSENTIDYNYENELEKEYLSSYARFNNEFAKEINKIKELSKDDFSLNGINTNYILINSFEEHDKIVVYSYLLNTFRKSGIVKSEQYKSFDYDDFKNKKDEDNDIFNGDIEIEKDEMIVIRMPSEYYTIFKHADSNVKDPIIHDGVDSSLYSAKNHIKKITDNLIREIKDKNGNFVIVFDFDSELEYDKNQIFNQELQGVYFKTINFNEISRDKIDDYYTKFVVDKVATRGSYKGKMFDDLQILRKVYTEEYTKIGENKFENTNIRALDNIIYRIFNEKYYKDGIIDENKYNEFKEKYKTGLEKLNDLKELGSVKEVIKKICLMNDIQRLRKEKKMKSINVSNHMFFIGNPGTGKTTVARIIAKILYDKGIINNQNIIEVGKNDLVSMWVGETEQKVKAKIEDAIGGVLFIDEAYSIADGSRDGRQIMNILVREMENYRDKIIMIFAGYKKEMNELIELNTGFASRIKNKVSFEDFSVDGLKDIAEDIAKKYGYVLSSSALKRIEKQCKVAKGSKDFGNARFVRNLINDAIERQSARLSEQPSITDDDMILISAEDIPNDKTTIEQRNIGFVA